MSLFPSPSWRARGWAVLAASLAAAATLAGAGCYKPNIVSGSFMCNTGYKAGSGDCPDGFHCSDGFCIKGTPTLVEPQPDVAPEAHPEAAPETKPEVGPDVTPDMPPMCNMPVTGCAPDTNKKPCDPTCQTGCGCLEKCSVNSGGTLTCNVPINSRLRAPFEPCNIANEGAATQTDDCAPGSVCLADGCGTRCFKFCTADEQCPNSTCTRDAGGGVKACEPPFMACNPIMNGMSDGCGTNDDLMVCYLSRTATDKTFCDCPNQAGRVNTACSVPRDCIYGLVCAGADPHCRQVCNLANSSADCLGGNCIQLNNSKTVGYCN